MVDVDEERTSEFNRHIVNMLENILESMDRGGVINVTFGIEDIMDEMTLQNIMGMSMDEEHDKTLQKNDNIELKFDGKVYIDRGEEHCCCVCLTEINKGEYVDVCEGCKCVNHYNCMNEWVKRKTECPTCRKDLQDKIVIKDNFKKFVEDELDI